MLGRGIWNFTRILNRFKNNNNNEEHSKISYSRFITINYITLESI